MHIITIQTLSTAATIDIVPPYETVRGYWCIGFHSVWTTAIATATVAVAAAVVIFFLL